MRVPVQQFVDGCIKKFNQSGGAVLEVGSLNVNGTVKQFFSKFDFYVGLDMRIGDNVSVQARGDRIPFKDNFFKCAISCETLEHDDNFFETIKEMKRVLAPGGMLILTVPGIGFSLHNHPSDYWRFTKDAMNVLLRGMNNIDLYEDRKINMVAGSGIKI